MAASFTAERKAGSGTIAVGTTFTFSPATNCTTGSTLYLIVVVDGSSNITAISDDGNNNWVLDKAYTGSGRCLAVASSYQTTGLTTAKVVTVTGANGMDYAYWFEEFAGNYSLVDKDATSTGSNVTSLPTGTTAATTDADEVAFEVHAISSTSATITKNANYTVFTTGKQTAGSSSTAGLGAYRILTATGTQNADGTCSAMVTSRNAVVTYRNVASLFSQPCNFQDPGLLSKALDAGSWRRRVRGILVPDLWLPNPAH